MEYAQNFNLLLGRLGKPDTSFQRVISHFLSLAVKSFNFMFHNILKLKNTSINKMMVFLNGSRLELNYSKQKVAVFSHDTSIALKV